MQALPLTPVNPPMHNMLLFGEDAANKYAVQLSYTSNTAGVQAAWTRTTFQYESNGLWFSLLQYWYTSDQ